MERLPSTILPRLIGRDAELALLDEAWADRTIRVLSVVAVGGAGKTALVHHWMQGFEQEGWKTKGASAALAWSFYSQGGGEDRQASGDIFIDAALRFFGEHHPPASARDRGLRLAELVRRRRTLLILDGLEPLQEPPASAQAGKVKDPAVAALIRALAADNPGLLVVTTREPVADLGSREGQGARAHDLEKLSDDAGAALLRWLGVEGREQELETVASEVYGHALMPLSLKPSEYFARQCWISADPDEAILPGIVDVIGDDNIVFASDYPHGDAIFPGAVTALSERHDLSEESKTKILGENANRLYGLK